MKMTAAQAHLADRMLQMEDKTGTYRRGGQSTTVSVILGQKLLRVEDSVGQSRTILTDQTVKIKAGGILFGGKSTEPAKGDTLELVLAGKTRIFEVSPPGANEKEWRYDPHGTLYVIHLQEVGTAGVGNG